MNRFKQWALEAFKMIVRVKWEKWTSTDADLSNTSSAPQIGPSAGSYEESKGEGQTYVGIKKTIKLPGGEQ